ncbi:MAG: hypothetical protein ABIW19_08360 [Vicinamibacterales bacterium]
MVRRASAGRPVWPRTYLEAHKIAAVVDSLDPAAVHLINMAGALSLFREGGASDYILQLEAPLEGHLNTSEIAPLLPEGMSGSEQDALMNVIFGFINRKETVAYLFGLAVGKRLGPMPLSTAWKLEGDNDEAS